MSEYQTLYNVQHMWHIMCNKEYFITVRVKEDTYVEISKLASEMEDGNISKFVRNLFKRVIKNAKNIWRVVGFSRKRTNS